MLILAESDKLRVNKLLRTIYKIIMKRKIFFMLNGIAVIFLSVILTSCSGNNEKYVIGLNQNIHHDDFEYSVTSFHRTSSLIPSPDTIATTTGNYYLVRFKVENRALRVDHRWDNSIAYIVDEVGKRYENSKEDQKILDESSHFGWQEQYKTRFGTSDSTILVFNLPSSVTKPYLMVRGGILMGDVFDRARFRKIRIKLF